MINTELLFWHNKSWYWSMQNWRLYRLFVNSHMPHSVCANSEVLEEVLEEVVETVDQKQLILFNDEVNTFDHVIDCLVSICDHERIQAEQCAVITHYKGRCSVKRGEWDELASMGTALGDRGLSVEIQ